MRSLLILNIVDGHCNCEKGVGDHDEFVFFNQTRYDLVQLVLIVELAKIDIFGGGGIQCESSLYYKGGNNNN